MVLYINNARDIIKYGLGLWLGSWIMVRDLKNLESSPFFHNIAHQGNHANKQKLNVSQSNLPNWVRVPQCYICFDNLPKNSICYMNNSTIKETKLMILSMLLFYASLHNLIFN